MCPDIDSASENTRDFSWGKGGRYVWLTTYHPCSAETSRKSGALIYPEPLGPPRSVAGDLYFTFYYICLKDFSGTNRQFLRVSKIQYFFFVTPLVLSGKLRFRDFSNSGKNNTAKLRRSPIFNSEKREKKVRHKLEAVGYTIYRHLAYSLSFGSKTNEQIHEPCA